MNFVWDESNRRHLARHDVLPEDAEWALSREPLMLDQKLVDGELRTRYLGASRDRTALLVIAAHPAQDTLRVITGWKANSRLARFWHTLKEV